MNPGTNIHHIDPYFRNLLSFNRIYYQLGVLYISRSLICKVGYLGDEYIQKKILGFCSTDKKCGLRA